VRLCANCTERYDALLMAPGNVQHATCAFCGEFKPCALAAEATRPLAAEATRPLATRELPYVTSAANACPTDSCALAAPHDGRCYLIAWLFSGEQRATLYAARKSTPEEDDRPTMPALEPAIERQPSSTAKRRP